MQSAPDFLRWQAAPPRRHRAAYRIAACLALLLLGTASSVAAERQVSITTIQGPSEPLYPEGGTAEVVSTAIVTCTSTVGIYDVSTLSVTYVPPPGVVLAGPATYQVPAQNCLLEPQREVQLTAGVSMTREAPGLVPLLVRVNATLAAAPIQDTAAASGEGQFQAVASYVGLVHVEVPVSIATMQDGLAAFELGFTNQGNAATQVELSVMESPPGVVVEVPAPLLLAAPGSDAADHGVVELRVHGRPQREGILVMAATPVALLDESQTGEVQTLTLLIRPEPSLRDAPGPGWAAAPLLALAAAVARRGR